MQKKAIKNWQEWQAERSNQLAIEGQEEADENYYPVWDRPGRREGETISKQTQLAIQA